MVGNYCPREKSSKQTKNSPFCCCCCCCALLLASSFVSIPTIVLYFSFTVETLLGQNFDIYQSCNFQVLQTRSLYWADVKITTVVFEWKKNFIELINFWISSFKAFFLVHSTLDMQPIWISHRQWKSHEVSTSAFLVFFHAF